MLFGGIYYFKSGKIKEKKNYLSDKLHGTFICYHNNGVTWIKSNYDAGLLEGKREVFCEKGEIKKIEFYKKGFKKGKPLH